MYSQFAAADAVRGFVGVLQLSTMVYAFGVRGTYEMISGKALYGILSAATKKK